MDKFDLMKRAIAARNAKEAAVRTFAQTYEAETFLPAMTTVQTECEVRGGHMVGDYVKTKSGWSYVFCPICGAKHSVMGPRGQDRFDRDGRAA